MGVTVAVAYRIYEAGGVGVLSGGWLGVRGRVRGAGRSNSSFPFS